MNLGRWGLAISLIAVVVAVVSGLLGDLGVGLTEAPPPADDLEQRVIDLVESHEERYLAYGRWEDLATAVAFAGLMVAAPFIEGTVRARHIITTGAAIAVVADVVDISQLVGIEVSGAALEGGHMTDFAVGNMYRIGVDRTSLLLWIAGVVITGVGMLVVARDAPSRTWSVLSGLFGLSLAVVGMTGVVGSPASFEIAQYAMGAVGLVWVIAAFPRTTSTVPGRTGRPKAARDGGVGAGRSDVPPSREGADE